MTMNIPATGKALLLAFLIAAPSILTGCKMKSGGKASEDSIFNLPEGQAAGALRIDSIYCRDPFIVADEASKTYYLYRSIPAKESGVGKVATFYSQTCFRFILECIYSEVFELDYEANQARKDAGERLNPSSELRA